MKKLKLREIKSAAQDDTVSKILLSSIKLHLHSRHDDDNNGIKEKKKKHRTQLNSSKAQAKSKANMTKCVEGAITVSASLH